MMTSKKSLMFLFFAALVATIAACDEPDDLIAEEAVEIESSLEEEDAGEVVVAAQPFADESVGADAAASDAAEAGEGTLSAPMPGPSLLQQPFSFSGSSWASWQTTKTSPASVTATLDFKTSNAFGRAVYVELFRSTGGTPVPYGKKPFWLTSSYHSGGQSGWP
jgi:hypothetical protein